MSRPPIQAAGGIVLKPGTEPRLAVVQLRKRGDWVLPKGKLIAGETFKAAAAREVLEETGHAVVLHEFVGTLAYQTNSRTKIVQFWRMEAATQPHQGLTKDVQAVDWLPLGAALQRLSRLHEREFLAHVGPLVLARAAAGPEGPSEAAGRPLSMPVPRPSLWERLTGWWRAADRDDI
jgi:8-oxo-dGTP diphosphatase